MTERSDSLPSSETNAVPEIEKIYDQFRNDAFASIERTIAKDVFSTEAEKAKAVLVGKFEYADDGIWFRTNGTAGFRAVPKESVNKALFATDFVGRLNSEYVLRSRERIGTLESIISPIIKNAAARNDKRWRFIVSTITASNEVRIQSIDYVTGNGFVSDAKSAMSTLANPKTWSLDWNGIGPGKVSVIEFAYGINPQQLTGLLNDRLEQMRKTQ